jgi:peptidoglycan/xylan/chitin deacetylase (PgdA/CDA1 family)
MRVAPLADGEVHDAVRSPHLSVQCGAARARRRVVNPPRPELLAAVVHTRRPRLHRARCARDLGRVDTTVRWSQRRRGERDVHVAAHRLGGCQRTPAGTSPAERPSIGCLVTNAVTTVDRPTDARLLTAAAVAPPFIPVLLYHAIGDAARPGLERYTTAKSVFVEHIQVLAGHHKRGATPELIDDLARQIRGERPFPARPFAVTFDDGYDDNLPAILALAEAGIPSTIYVTASYVGRRGMLDAERVTLLARHPMVEVGAHTVRHLRLDELTRDEVQRELHDAREFLQEITGVEIRSVAYPHGAHDRRVLTEVRRAGYSSGAAVKNALSHPGDDPLAIARWTVLDHHSAADIGRVLDGGLSIVGSSEHLRTRGYRAVRRSRRMLAKAVGRAS